MRELEAACWPDTSEATEASTSTHILTRTCTPQYSYFFNFKKLIVVF